MIIFGWGHVTKKFYGVVSRQACPECFQQSGLELCLIREWFTLFFIPVIPYETVYCIYCPRCQAYKPLDRETFMALKETLATGDEEGAKYVGKTPTQIAYLKGQEEARKKGQIK